MKQLIWIPVLIAGCSSQPQMNVPTQMANLPAVQVVYDSKVQQMSRNEVIMATHECESTGLRPVPIITKRMIGVGGMMSEMIVDVVCMPKPKY
jgi:hypothetical protein